MLRHPVEEGSSIPEKKRREDEGHSFTQLGDIRIPDEAEVGIVEKLELVNFMCHSQLQVHFGSNVNFVIGRNGSGKSAILTALIVGLGGNAGNANRGVSLKGFIKEGCTFASISIHLRNRGTDAFKPEVYGDTIIVERRLNSDGVGSYKIKSSQNQIISTLKGELIEILDQFSIIVDNPVSILTQDTARSFLNTSNEHLKYRFFFKSTQLEQMRSDYQEALQQKKATEAMLERKKKILLEMHEQLKIHENKYKDLEQLKLMGSQIEELKKDLAWAYVSEKSKEVEQSKKWLEKCMIKIPDYEKHINNTIAHEKKVETLYKEKTGIMNTYNEDAQLLFAEKIQLHRKYKEKRKSMMNSCEEVKRAQHDMQSQEKDRLCLIEKIGEMRQTALKNRERGEQERELQLEACKQRKQQLQSELFASSIILSRIETAVKNTQEQKNKMTSNLSEVRKQVKAIRQRVTALQATKKDSLSRFGKATDSIMKAIDHASRSGKFHLKPVGPLGAFIVLIDQCWAKAVEETIKGMMCAFVCHDNHDMLILREIFKQKCTGCTRFPTIVVSKFSDRLYDTSQSRPLGYSPITTVLDILDIKNHIVANALIDQIGIESILLIESPGVAQNVMWNIVPRGSTMAVSLEGHQIIGGRSSKYYPCKDRDVIYFQEDTVASFQGLEDTLSVEQRKEEELKRQLQEVAIELNNHRNDYAKTKQNCSREQGLINSVEIEIRDLQSHDDERLIEIDVLQTEVEEIEERLKRFSVELGKLTLKLEEKREDTERFSVAIKECDEKCQTAGDTLEAFQEEVGVLKDELGELKAHKTNYMNKLVEQQELIAQAHKEYTKVHTEYQKLHNEALNNCEERETTRTVASLCSEIRTAQMCADNDENAGEIMNEEIMNKYEAAMGLYKKAEEEVENCLKLRKALEKAILRRSKRFVKFQDSIEHRTQGYFGMLLSQRGYTGKLIFDHERETLTVKVNVENAQGTSTSDTKTLSGGEQSFSTICFIMALWEAVEAPFRCLDEFDVFMDMVNRRISMRMLMKLAKEQTHRQFILLTPQDISSIRGTDTVRIFKLTDPER